MLIKRHNFLYVCTVKAQNFTEIRRFVSGCLSGANFELFYIKRKDIEVQTAEVEGFLTPIFPARPHNAIFFALRLTATNLFYEYE